MGTADTIIRIFVFLMVVCSCAKQEIQSSVGIPGVVVILPLSGLGDEGYNDACYSSLIDFAASNPETVEMTFELIEDVSEFDDFIRMIEKEKASYCKVLYVLWSDEYRELAEKFQGLLPGHDVFFLGADTGIPGCKTAYIDAGEEAYESGRVLAKIGNNEGIGQFFRPVVMCMDENDPIIEAFSQGFLSVEGTTIPAVYHFQEDIDEIDFDVVYARTSELALDYNFILPISGQYNSAIYRYSRETGLLTAGMDVYGENISQYCMFSIIRRPDLVLSDWLGRWLSGESIPDVMKYGDGYCDFHINPSYSDYIDVEENH